MANTIVHQFFEHSKGRQKNLKTTHFEKSNLSKTSEFVTGLCPVCDRKTIGSPRYVFYNYIFYVRIVYSVFEEREVPLNCIFQLTSCYSGIKSALDNSKKL